METDTMMIDETMCCLGCGETYPSPTGWVDVIDTETMTAGVVCHESCVFEDEGLIQIPAHAFALVEPDIPEWAYTDTETTEPQPVAMVDEAKVIQILAPWDSPTDILMYEFNDGEEGVDY
tara:strand:+ start:4959 stop:5318 length:360 start_codon:yes stop_codon:yes gene_type:complete